MPKLRVLSGDDVCRILALHGFVRERQKGSHIAMQRRAVIKDDVGNNVVRMITVGGSAPCRSEAGYAVKHHPPVRTQPRVV